MGRRQAALAGRGRGLILGIFAENREPVPGARGKLAQLGQIRRSGVSVWPSRFADFAPEPSHWSELKLHKYL